jgi:hypothetical protein
MDVNVFKAELESLTGQISELIEQVLPEKGLKAEDSQKCALRIALGNLEATIFGIEASDLVPLGTGKAMYRVFDIQWDQDEDDDAELPGELEVSVEHEDEIGDKISDQVGYCHFGFQFERL